MNAGLNHFLEADGMLQVYERRQIHTRVLVLPRQFDYRTKIGLQTQIFADQDRASQHVILDFSDVMEIDSTQLHDLFLWYYNLKNHNLIISVVKPPSWLRYHEDWTYLEEIVAIYRSLDDVDDVMEQRESDG